MEFQEGKMKKVLVPLAPGFEEIEALTIVDILRRAGAQVTVAGTIPGAIEGRSGIRVLPDTVMENAGDSFDMIALPGGAVGAENLKKNAYVKAAVEKLARTGKSVAAICAAPTVLSAAGVTGGHVITSHPSVRDQLSEETVSEERVVVDGNIITSQGPGTAMEFAFCLVETLFGKAKATEVNKGVLARV
jgi:4-methyl-5(b-hydroxyethyl)-thiazole monophosphate biosynthesis